MSNGYVSYVARLVDIIHLSPTTCAFDVEERNDRCAISIKANQSLEIEYLDRDGVRNTSKICAINDACPLGCEGRQGCVYVSTLNSVYVFDIDEGKYDHHEIAACLNNDWQVQKSMLKALEAFAAAFA